MKREDETLLQYLIRLAKEGGEDFSEGYGELANQRLIRSRPDVARERGLMPDQWVEDDYMTPSVQDSLLPPQVTDTAGADRATIEQTMAQRTPPDLTGLETARMPEVVDPMASLMQYPSDALQSREGGRRTLTDIEAPIPDSGQIDTVGELDQGRVTSDYMTEGLIRGALPREPGQLPNELLKDRKEQDVTKTNLLERAQTFLQKNIPEERLKGATGIEEFLKRAVGQTGKGFGHVQPGRLATYGFGGAAWRMAV